MFFAFLFDRWIKDYPTPETFFKYLRLSAIFFAIIGVYSIMMPTKDTVFLKTVGAEYLAYVKIIAVLVIIPLVLIYSTLSNYISRHKLLYVVSTFYAIITLCCGIWLMHPIHGLANTELSPYRLIGWIWYATVESFGSIMVTTFWGFVADISQPGSAKQGFNIIALGAQVGGFITPLLLHKKACAWGPQPFFFLITIGIGIIILLTYYFIRVTPVSELTGFSHVEKKDIPKTSFFEGLRLIYKEKYLQSILAIVGLYEIILIFFEIQLKIFANTAYPDINMLHGFFFKYSIFSNGIALFSLALGAHKIKKYASLAIILLITPLLVSGLLVSSLFILNLDTLFYTIVTIRGINYSFNQPAKEQLYIPTSHDVKYKAKGWIDIFGARFGKSVGSSLHLLQPMLHSIFSKVTTSIIGILLIIWVYAIYYGTRRYAQALQENKSIGT